MTMIQPPSINLADQLKKLDACIHCGMCLPACPTYQETASEAESPRGRLYLMRAFLENKLESPEDLARHIDPCLGCLACETACPSNVEYDSLLQQTRQRLVTERKDPIFALKRSFRRLCYAYLLRHNDVLDFMAMMLKFVDLIGLRRVLQQARFLDKTPLAFLKATPSIQAGNRLRPGEVYGENIHGRVAMLTGCVMNAAFRQTNRATVDVLVANGYQVVIPEQSCCGALALHAGEVDIFQNLLTLNWRWLKDSSFDWIVSNSAGCGAALKHCSDFAPNKLNNTYAVTNRIVDVMALLAKRPLMGTLGEVNAKVTYHAACHLHHAQGVQREPYEVLLQIPGIELIPLRNADACCGSAGVYNLAHPIMADTILDKKTEALLETDAQIVVTGNPGCMMQIESGLGQANSKMLVLHPVELLHMAYNKGKALNKQEDQPVETALQ